MEWELMKNIKTTLVKLWFINWVAKGGNFPEYPMFHLNKTMTFDTQESDIYNSYTFIRNYVF